MGIDFSDPAAMIEANSTRPEFQNASIVIYQPGEVGEYDPDTGEYEQTDPTLLYRGQARIVGLRSYRADEADFNPTALKPVRVQVKRDGIEGRVVNNCKAYFTDGGRNPQLTSLVFNVNSDFNSSHVAAYTFEMTVDLDAVDDTPPQFDDDGDYVPEAP